MTHPYRTPPPPQKDTTEPMWKRIVFLLFIAFPVLTGIYGAYWGMCYSARHVPSESDVAAFVVMSSFVYLIGTFFSAIVISHDCDGWGWRKVVGTAVWWPAALLKLIAKLIAAAVHHIVDWLVHGDKKE